MNKAYDTFFDEPKPVRDAPLSILFSNSCLRDCWSQCRTCVAVKELPFRTDVEIELTAHL